MATVPSAPPVANAVQPSVAGESSITKIEAFGVKLEIPLPKWAIACLAVLLIALGCGAAIYWGYPSVTKTVLVPTAQAEVYEESAFHSTEPKTLREEKEESFEFVTVAIHYFKSDGCVEIVRWNDATHKGDGLWMFGEHPHTPVHNHPTNHSATAGYPAFSQGTQRDLKFISDDDLGFGTGHGRLYRVQQGRCLDPHPGAFNVYNQAINQCLVQVWRTFYDGCVHFQYFNPCLGTWDVYPNGAPRVYWTQCVH